MWHGLETGALDFIVDAEPKVSDKFNSRVLYKDSFGLYASKSYKHLEVNEPLTVSFVRRAIDRQDKTIEFHLTRLNVDYQLRYDVESFTMARSLASEGLCSAVLPLRLAQSSKLVPITFQGKDVQFGEHRICITNFDSQKDHMRTKAIVSTLVELF